MPRRIRIVLSLLSALLLTGCFFDFIAWSPDGRYLVYPCSETKGLLRYDTQSGEYLLLAGGQKAMSPRYGSDDRLYAMAADDLPTTPVLIDIEAGQALRSLTPTHVYPPIRQLPGSRTYLVVRKAADDRYEMLECAFDGSQPEILFAADQEFYHPAPSPNAGLVAFVAENRLMLWQRDRDSTRNLVQEEKTVFLWPQFRDASRLLYTATQEGEDFGRLMSLDLETGLSRSLCEGVVGTIPWSLHPGGERVALTVCTPLALPGSAEALGLEGIPVKDYDDYPLTLQILEIDLDSGEKRLLTQDSLGSLFAPSYDPGGQRLACLQGEPDDLHLLHLLELDGTGGYRITGYGPGPAEFARAEMARREGRPAEARDIYGKLLQQEGIAPRIAEWSHFRLMEAALTAGDAQQARLHAAGTGSVLKEQTDLCLRRAGLEAPAESKTTPQAP